MASKSSVEKERKPTDEAVQDPEASPPAEETEEREFVYTTRWYWTSLVLSAAALVLALLYYDPTLPVFFVWASWFVIAVSAILVVYTAIGLVNRYRIMHRVRRGGRELARRSHAAIRGSAKQARNRTTSAGPRAAGGANKAGQGVGRMGRAVGRGVAGFFKFLYRLILRIVYIIEFLVVWILILTYDIVYGVLYAAWWLSYHALRLAWKILYFLLRVAWKVVRLPLLLPGLRGVWADKMRPKILGRWKEFVATRREKWATFVERRKRLAAARGRDPEEWHREKVMRHWFPLPLPHHAKDALYARLEHAAQTKDRRVAKGHPFKTKEERELAAAEAEAAEQEAEEKKGKEPPEEKDEETDEEAAPKKKKRKRWKDKAKETEPDARPTE